MALPVKGEYPIVARALRGWTRRRWLQIVTQVIDDETGLATRTVANYKLPVAIQPMPAREVERMREDQRDWGWWTIWLKSTIIDLSIDDAIVVDGKSYLVASKSDWRGGGYREYKCHESWEGELP